MNDMVVGVFGCVICVCDYAFTFPIIRCGVGGDVVVFKVPASDHRLSPLLLSS